MSYIRPNRSGDMTDLYGLSDEQMAKLSPFFPKSHGKPRVDDRRVLSGIIFINRKPIQKAPQDREQLCPPQGLVAGGNTLRQTPESVPLSLRSGSSGHVLAMNPDPNLNLH